MERHFDQELKELEGKLLAMAGLVEESIRRAGEALKAVDADGARRIIADDAAIDAMEIEVDGMALGLLSRYQPLAGDLRFVTNAMKINAELERIADLSVDIAQRALDLAGQPLLKPLVDIPKMTLIAQRMVRGAIEAFIARDIEEAKRVILADQEADSLRNRVQQELVYDYVAKDGACAPRAVPLLLVARHLERICDHATNIAEDVVSMVSGEVVKHHPERL